MAASPTGDPNEAASRAASEGPSPEDEVGG
jgi:hypothetical protein